MVECAMEGRGYWGDWPRPKGNSGGLFPIGKSPLEYEQLPRPFITPPSTKAVVHKYPWVPARVLVRLFPLRNSTTEPGRGGVSWSRIAPSFPIQDTQVTHHPRGF
jgi:hypothetical protein